MTQNEKMSKNLVLSDGLNLSPMAKNVNSTKHFVNLNADLSSAIILNSNFGDLKPWT